jgi:DNA replication protein DnaC
MNKLIPLGIKSSFDDEIKSEYYSYYLNIDFLVIDEVGKEVEGQKKANVTILEEVIRHRDFSRQPTCIISNLTMKDFEDRYGTSILSLIRARYLDIRFGGEDNRKARHRELLDRLSEE